MTRDAKEQLMLTLLPFIRSTAAVFARRTHICREDAEQEAVIAAWTRIDKFDASRGYQLWTYIKPRIVGAMLDMVRRGNFFGRKGHRQPKPRSLNQLLRSNSSGDEPTTLAETIADYRETPADIGRQQESFDDRVHSLLPSERKLLRRLFVDEKLQREVAEEAGVTESAISQKLNAIIKRLRRYTVGGKVAPKGEIHTAEPPTVFT